MLNNLQEILSFHYVYPLPLNKFHILMKSIESTQNLIETSPAQLAKILAISTKNAGDILSKYQQVLKINLLDVYNSSSIKAIPYTSDFYPKDLYDLIDPPTILYAKGNISLLKEPRKIAIIGSRKATNYSSLAMEYIVPPLVEQKIVIVSGLAKGADSLAHRAAIQYGGKTIAVLGHGFSHIYPRENKELACEIARNHLLLTEYPPYVGVQKWQFPMRNRIISGISNAIVVTEASLKSGTLITTEHALEHGKDIFVVPGPIQKEQSKGTNSLLREGAIPISDGYQIIEELKLF
ncbi:DNA-processing protein DprA [Ureibacillus aquaedulcis]|uniref:DNA-processing protein DprA n=1 Tax=Ureibacillus aquaedulcis TaxID=3058421 RepID=A0ABT8GTM1_9BACL|nr:DNA-processing protein DprA [Ureibacillus sp. BA0131]MDN4494231.1 DNA-processing protein DprA [Ureibacillus sp. BA0131]